MRNLIKIKVDVIFYYYYFSLLCFSDTPNTYSDEFIFIHDKYKDDIFKILSPTNVNDEQYVEKIKQLIKFIDTEREYGKTMYIIRNLLISEKFNDINFILTHELLKQKNFQKLQDLEFFVKQPQINKEFVKMLKNYVKNILSIKYINSLTDVLIENISDTEVQNISKITKKFEEILHNYLNEDNILSYEQVYISPNNVDGEIRKVIDSKISKIFNIEIIPTKFKLLDSIIGGGLQKGRVYLILGKTGQGKSSFIINLVKNFLEQGKNVLFYTFENTVEETLERLFSCITQIPMSEFKNFKDDLINKVSEFFTKYGGTINVVYSPAETVSTEMIKEKVKILGNNVDIIVVDYLDLLKYKKNVEERIRTMKLVRQLKNLAQETNTTIITPSQVHRSVYRSKIVEVDNVSESFGKISESDGVFILETNSEDLQNNIIRLNIGKLRHGKSGIRLEMNVNFDIMTFTETGKIITDIDEIEKESGTSSKRKKQKQIEDIEEDYDDFIF